MTRSGGRTVVLGAGMTGLGAGRATGGAVYEASAVPGGICASYYRGPEAAPARAGPRPPSAYRFEVGGGHWIFGGEPAVLGFIEELAPTRRYTRRSSVYFPDDKLHVPYPLQNHLRCLGPSVAARALAEITGGATAGDGATMRDWLRATFGPTLDELFFRPFHELYTAGLYERIAPQDGYKSPIDRQAVIAGASGAAPPAGYNVRFRYPAEGLDTLARRLAEGCDVTYGRRAVRIDTRRAVVEFADGPVATYDRLVSTLPLTQALELAGLDAGPPDPYTSVLVVNIGARRGPACPDDHWIYVPRSRAGFHRVGFYDNVDPSFLPPSPADAGPRVALYVERAYPGGVRPAATAVERYVAAVVEELQAWRFIDALEVADPTWIEVAYTWSWPGSRWRETALARLAEHGVLQVGRYARWTFQGIADSLRDGLAVGAGIAPA